VQVIQQGRIVFVQDDHCLQSGLPVGTLYKPRKTHPRRGFVLVPSIEGFVILQLHLDSQSDFFHAGLVFASAHVEMQNGVFFPVLLQLGDGQALEQVLASLEVILQGAAKQALAEPARTAEEDELRFSRQFINKVSLVNVDASVLTDAFKIGDTGGVESHG